MRTHGSVKSATAFRTISEVSAELDVPQHVLRFWETKFPQIRPLKRGGGRRYYRPEDVELLRRIQTLLRRERYTIEGVQRLLKEGRAEDPNPGKGADESDHEVGVAEPKLDDESPADDDLVDPAALPEVLRCEIALVLDELKALRVLLGEGGRAKKKQGNPLI